MAIDIDRFKTRINSIIKIELKNSIANILKKYDEEKNKLKEQSLSINIDLPIKKRKLSNNSELIDDLELTKNVKIDKCKNDYEHLSDEVESTIQDNIRKCTILNYLNNCSQFYTVNANYYSPIPLFNFTDTIACRFLHLNNDKDIIFYNNKLKVDISNYLYDIIRNFIIEETYNNFQLMNSKLDEFKYVVLNFDQFMNDTRIIYEIFDIQNEIKDYLVIQLEKLFRINPDNKSFFNQINDFYQVYDVVCIPINDHTHCGLLFKRRI